MKEQWKRFAGRFDGLSLRERALVACALLATLVAIAYVAAIEPQWLRHKALAAEEQQQAEQLRQLRAQTQEIQALRDDPDAALRARLQTAREQLSAADSRLRALESALVPPQQISHLLEDMLAVKRGLRLVSLRSLATAPLIDPARATPKEASDQGAEGYGGNIFRHGVEITLLGSYADLAAYLTELERLPRRMFWQEMKLHVEEHPRARLTLTVYTLSLDKSWLIL